ncbi:MAG: sulfotransferase domain-containing protein [Roseinatronobacter sp.]
MSTKVRGTFVLGLGAQKSGTSWLHDYLTTLDGVDMGFLKEYHVFDALRDDSSQIGDLAAKAQKVLAESGLDVPKRKNFWTQISFLADHRNYYNFFAGVLSQSGIRLTGDMTPCYSLLDAAMLTSIREGFAQRDVTCKAVFLMRDPVERLWSASRMWRMNRREAAVTDENVFVVKCLKRPMFDLRTRYEDTLAAMEAVFAPDDCLTGFYETLFQDSEIQRICAFLGLEFRAPEFDKRVNVSQKTSPLSQDTCRTVAQHFAPTYRAVAERFGQARVLDLWPSARFVL